eukprot:4257693-Prymnesium_polylepis.1
MTDQTRSGSTGVSQPDARVRRVSHTQAASCEKASGKQLKKAWCQACAAWRGARRRLQSARVTAAGGACGRLQWPLSGHAVAAAGAAHPHVPRGRCVGRASAIAHRGRGRHSWVLGQFLAMNAKVVKFRIHAANLKC